MLVLVLVLVYLQLLKTRLNLAIVALRCAEMGRCHAGKL